MATVDGEPDMMAAELALGLLEGDERAVALRRLIAEPAFAREVERWRDWLAALFALWPEATPPEGLDTRIEATLDAQGRGGVVADHGARWRMVAIAASLAACLLLALTTTLPLRPEPAPRPQPQPQPQAAPAAAPLLAAITPTDQASRTATPIAAAYHPDTGVVRIAGAVTVPTGRSAELWAITGTAAPRPLGLLDANGASQVTVRAADRATLGADTVLAISIEPAGGSPSGAPTGPVVATGKLSG